MSGIATASQSRQVLAATSTEVHLLCASQWAEDELFPLLQSLCWTLQGHSGGSFDVTTMPVASPEECWVLEQEDLDSS